LKVKNQIKEIQFHTKLNKKLKKKKKKFRIQLFHFFKFKMWQNHKDTFAISLKHNWQIILLLLVVVSSSILSDTIFFFFFFYNIVCFF
jgi:hypothetical protein